MPEGNYMPVNDEITVSYSELSKFRQCPHSHDLAYMQRWSRPNEQGSPLHKGTMWHVTLEAHYNALREGKDAKAAGYAQIRDFAALGTDPEVIDLIKWMYQGYLERYGLDSSWEILEVEYRFETPLRTKAGRRSGFRLKGGVDILARNKLTGKIWVWDHKTASVLPKDRDLGLDQQLWLYGWAMRELGVPVYGAIYSVSRTQRNKTKAQTLDERFSRILVAFEDDVLKATAADALSTVRSAYSKFNQKERHPDPELCKRRCSYFDACLVGRSSGDAAERVFLEQTGFRINMTRH